MKSSWTNSSSSSTFSIANCQSRKHNNKDRFKRNSSTQMCVLLQIYAVWCVCVRQFSIFAKSNAERKKNERLSDLDTLEHRAQYKNATFFFTFEIELINGLWLYATTHKQSRAGRKKNSKRTGRKIVQFAQKRHAIHVHSKWTNQMEK